MILRRLKEDVVLGDGGALFELERRGYVSAGPFTPEVSIEHPEALKQLQTEFARAGAQVLQALTYYAHEEKLRHLGRAGILGEINASAVRIAREVADEYDCLVAGNLANTWV
jgi:betaine-homocysteine S-methyltransferase